VKNIVALFDNLENAHGAVADLTKLGLGKSDISVITQEPGSDKATVTRGGKTEAAEGAGIGATTGAVAGAAAGILATLGMIAIPGIGGLLAAGPIVTALTGAGVGAAAGGLVGGLIGMGIPEEHAEQYAEGIRRGGTVVSALAPDEKAQQVSDIFDRHDAVNLDARTAQWQRSGWKGRATPTAAASTAATQTAAPAPAPAAAPAQPASTAGRHVEATQRIPIVEESLKVGKREVGRGGVRVYARVTEQPVSEQVRLREEHVHVERRPVDRPANPEDLRAFKEGAIEMRETAEEAVVQKEARVTGEVVVRKDVTEKTETVRDTVRRTDVKVDRVGNTNTGAEGTASGPACNT
jgi:uncharacterized protein (TIGR02271 family)